MNDLKKESRRLHSDQQVRVTGETLRQWMEIFSARIREAESQLTQLDCAIGDGDHGINMVRGMNTVESKLNELARADLSGQLRIISTTLMGSVGGASGPLYGAFFLQSSHSALHKVDLGVADLTLVVEAGYRGVVQLGKAEVGDKTMVDAMAGAIRSLRASCARHESMPEALDNCRKATRHAAADTTPMIARKGRASYLGVRSAGVQDPGATSTSLLFDSLAEALSPRLSTSRSNSAKPVLI